MATKKTSKTTRKQGSKSSGTRKKSVPETKPKKKLNPEVVNYLKSVVLIALGLIALMTKGLIGVWLTRISMFLFGKFYIVVFILMVVYGIWIIFSMRYIDLSNRIYFGLLLIVLAVLLHLAIPADHAVGKAAFEAFWAKTSDIFNSRPADPLGGIIGAGLYFVTSSLADYTGTLVIFWLMLLLALVLIVDRKYFLRFAEKVKEGSIKTVEKIQEVRNREPEPRRPKEQLVTLSTKQEKKTTDIKVSDFNEMVRHEPNGIITLAGNSSSKTKSYEEEQYTEEPQRPLTVKNKPSPSIKEEPRESDYFQDTQLQMNLPEEEENEADMKAEMEERTKYSDYKNYHLPNLGRMLDPSSSKKNMANVTAAREKGERLIEVLDQFSIHAALMDTHIGPSVTKFVIRPEASINVNRIVNIQDNIKMELAARTIRIEAPIPGMRGVGVEIPNVENTTVHMRDLLMNVPDKFANKPLAVALGKDLFDTSVFCDLEKMPHLLVAGATGSGKSVCMNAIICSLLLRQSPADVKLLLIDPKKVEFSEYKDVPHLLGPVVSDPKTAARILQVVVQMMNDRYDKFAKAGVKKLDEYNRWVENKNDPVIRKMPYIVVIIDELADLMVVAGKEVEQSVQRITQLARAAGIHLIVATQRPSTDVITGVIKANIPSRISFAVTNGIDSKVILDQTGAENLLGNGDMLYKPQGITPKRLQGVFVTDEEVHRITGYVSRQAKPYYADEIFNALHSDIAGNDGYADTDKDDPMYSEVLKFVVKERKASTSLIQRKFGLGYNRAARIVDLLQERGVVGPANGSKPREVFVQDTEEE